MDTDCTDWARKQLSADIESAHIEFALVKRRSWSTVWRADTAGRKYYLKAAAPGFDVEARILPYLHGQQPNLLVEPIAAEPEKGWILTADAGQPLREITPEAALDQLEAVLPVYAEMQIEAAQTGVPEVRHMLEDRSLTNLPTAFERVIREPGLLAAGGATADDISRCSEWSDLCLRLCGQLAVWRLPMTLEHGDFHAGNLLVSGKQVRIADWGDACWSHPFFSLVVCLDSARDVFGLEASSSHMQRLRRAYFKVWQDIGFDADIEDACALAQQLRPAHAVLQWSRGLASLPEEARVLAARYMMDWLRTFT